MQGRSARGFSELSGLAPRQAPASATGGGCRRELMKDSPLGNDNLPGGKNRWKIGLVSSQEALKSASKISATATSISRQMSTTHAIMSPSRSSDNQSAVVRAWTR
jgi:hypothetical protein